MVVRNDFESKAEKNMLVRKSLYGLKISGAALSTFLADTLDAVGYIRGQTDKKLTDMLVIWTFLSFELGDIF